MPQYLSQYVPGVCPGIIAVTNAMKWLGYPASKADAYSAYELPGLEVQSSTGRLRPVDVNRYISKLCADYEVDRSPFHGTPGMRLGWLTECLQQGWGVILFYRRREDNGQLSESYSFFDGVSANGKRFYYPGGTQSYVTRATLRRVFYIHSDLLPFAWIVRPVQQEKRPRYIKQTDTYSCGPIGIINGFKWLGCSVTASELPLLRGMCETYEKGTYRGFMERGIRHCCEKFDIPRRFVRRLKPVAWGAIKKELQQHNSVLAEVFWRKRDEGHYFLYTWQDVDTDFCEVVNYHQQITSSFLFRDELRADVKRLRCGWVFDHKAALLT